MAEENNGKGEGKRTAEIEGGRVYMTGWESAMERRGGLCSGERQKGRKGMMEDN